MNSNQTKTDAIPAGTTETAGSRSRPGTFFSTSLIIARREIRTLLRNRFFHAFAILAIAGGLLTTGSAPSAAAIPFILLQLILYLIPLFAILIGLSSAHGELEEQSFLFSQPIPRLSVVAGKASALILSLALLLGIAFISPLIYAPKPAMILVLWSMALLLGAVFTTLGLTIGFSTGERTRGIILTLILWLLALIGFDLLAYLSAMTPFMNQYPLLWLGILLINPIDAVRMAVLLKLEEIPFTVASDTPLIGLWLEWLIPWVFLLGAIWIAILFLWSHWRISRREN